MQQGTTWWLATSSKYTGTHLLREFHREEVGGILLDSVEQVVDTPLQHNGIRVVMLRLKYPAQRQDRYCMEICLTELGLGLLDPIPQLGE